MRVTLIIIPAAVLTFCTSGVVLEPYDITDSMFSILSED
jgi:hypothetical protein